MNRQQLIKEAQRQIDEKRFRAEEKTDRTLSELRKNPEYKNCEKQLRLAQLNKASSEEIKERKRQLNEVLKSLGLSEKSVTPSYSCPHCNDTGYINGAICSCLEQEICKLITAESNVINREFTFANSTEKNKHNVAVYKQAAKICSSGKGNLLLLGNTGSGKTYLITACVNDIITQNKSVLFTTAYTLNSMFLDAHLSDYKTGQSILDTLTDVDVLAIDDLGTEINYKNVTAEYLFVVINERLARHKQTLISTNLTLADIRDRYDERIFSRLIDQSLTTVAKLDSVDKRVK